MPASEPLKKPYCHSSSIKVTAVIAAALFTTVVLYSLVSVQHSQWVEVQLSSSSKSTSQERKRIVIGQGQTQLDWDRRHSLARGTVRRARVFEMAGSLSHFDIMTKMMSKKFHCGNKLDDTSLTHSKIKLTNVNEKIGELNVVIETYDRLGNRKTTGLDVIVVWGTISTQKHGKLKANLRHIAGSVTDHINGSYTAKLVLPSTGFLTIHAKVLSIFRIQCLRFKAMQRYGNSVFATPSPHGVHFIFRRERLTDYTRCGPIDRIYGYSELCNFTSLNHNYSYFCGKPRHGLLCSDFDTFVMKAYNLTEIPDHRSGEDIIFDPGWGNLEQTVNISITKLNPKNFQRKQTVPYCMNIPKQRSWKIAPSEIFVDDKSLKSIICKTKSMDKTMVTQCLSNKTVLIVGDSTFRQYLDIAQSYVNGSLDYYPLYVTLTRTKDNINMTWRKHELPYHNRAKTDPLQVRTVTDRIIALANDATIKGSELILGFTYNTHLQAFRPSVFRDRIKRLVKALKYLFAKKPEVTVLLKGPHVANNRVKWFDTRLSLLYSEIAFEEFSTIRDKVWYLDTFLISVLNDNMILHPHGVALDNQLQQFLSFVCP